MKQNLLKTALIALIAGRGSDDPEIPIVLPTISNIIVRDISNFANARDLELSFEKPQNLTQVDEFRIFILKSSNKNSFDSLQALNATNGFIPLDKTVSSVQIIFDENTVDIDGDLIKEELSYNIFVFTLATAESKLGGELSSASSNISLEQKSAVRTLTNTINAGSGGMDVDAEGNIYMADFGLNLSGAPGTKVFKITPEGEVSTFASGLGGASGNDFDDQGNLYQSNIQRGTISKITPEGTVSTFASGLSSPVGIAYDGESNFYVCNCGNNTISEVDASGNVSLFSSGNLFNCPNGIDIDENGNLYVANFSSSTIVKITPDGTASSFATMPVNNNGHLLINEGFIYVVARGNHSIYRISFQGDVRLFAGKRSRGADNGSLTQATFSLPNDLAFSPDGSKIYINDVAGSDPDGSVIGPVIIREIDLVN